LEHLHVDPVHNKVDWIHHFEFGAKASNLDLPTLREIQNMPKEEMEKWYSEYGAMDLEFTQLKQKITYIEIPCSQVPSGHQIVKSSWAFKQKHRPSSEIYELKAHFVVRGDLQILDKSQSTFSLVVEWSTVCLLFVLTVAQGLQSQTIDFNNAFIQSALPESKKVPDFKIRLCYFKF